MIAQEERVKGMSYIEDAELKIRLAVKDYFFFGKRTKAELDRYMRNLIQKASIAQPEAMRQAVYNSLFQFYWSQYRTLQQISQRQKVVFLALLTVSQGGKNAKAAKEALRGVGVQVTGGTGGADNVYIAGVPAQVYQQDFYNRNIKPIIETALKQEPLDPTAEDYGKKRTSLRNRAEMEARYQAQKQNVQDMIDGGNRLVIASEHTNCSPRCRRWQGRVYSMDGTSGTTPDGRKFVPLEVATDQYYTTKAGKVYKNGLLGFNCRHYLVPYKDGFRFPKQSQAQEAKAYSVDLEQRRMERQVRKWKTERDYKSGINAKEKRYADRKVKEWTARYKQFSHKNNVPWYQNRITI